MATQTVMPAALKTYSTGISIYEDTSKNFELIDLLRQADPTYSASAPEQMKLYVKVNGSYVEVPGGFFSAVDKDTLNVSMASLPNFNGPLDVAVLGTDSSGGSYLLYVHINVLPVNDAPTGTDFTTNVGAGDSYIIGVNDFGFRDPVDGDAFKSVIITKAPNGGSLTLNGVPVISGQEILVGDIAAGKLVYHAPTGTGGDASFSFQVRDNGGLVGDGAADLDPVPKSFNFHVAPSANGAITGIVLDDTNHDGLGDTPLAGVVIQLKDSSGRIVGTTVTNDCGEYLFINIPAGTYTVVETNKAGYIDVTDKDGGDPNSITVVVPPGGSSTCNFFVDTRASATLGDKVWVDNNGNGVQDAGEVGLAGVTVKLLNTAGAVVASTTTGADGSYRFTNLVEGDYVAKVDVPAGYTLTGKDKGGNDAIDSDFDPLTGMTDRIHLSAGQTNTSLAAGMYQKVSIGDKVWLDSNGNGVQDSGEAGVACVTVNLLDSSGKLVASTLTDGNGNYQFKDLAPGYYSVQFVAPNGKSFTIKDAGTDDSRDSDVGVTLGTTNLIVNGSFEQGSTGWVGNGDTVEVGGAWQYGVTGSTGNYVAELDANKTGTVTGFYQDVATVAGQTYQLSVDLAMRANTPMWTNTVEVWWGGVKVASIDPNTTNLTTYTFKVTGNGGTTRLEFREEAGDDDSFGGIIDNVRLVTMNGVGGTQTTDQFFVGSGQNDTSRDAGLVDSCPPNNGLKNSSIGDKVWVDANGNGVQDAGEVGAAGVTVKLLNSAGVVVASTLTDASGSYVFNSLQGGDYRVQIVAPTGYGFTKQHQGMDGNVDSDVNSTGLSDIIHLGNNTSDMSQDAGLVSLRTASIGDRVWEDANGNGIQDAGEGGLGGITVKLVDSLGGVYATTTTDANGYYVFNNLAAGSNYRIVVVAPSGYAYTKLHQGTNTGADSDVDASGYSDFITLKDGQADMSWDAGLVKKNSASIGDRVWLDANGNGIQDAGEAGLAGVTVKLVDYAGRAYASTTTDANGYYVFKNLAPGSDYRIVVVAPNGYTFTGQHQGGNLATDSDVDKCGYSDFITLTEGQADMSWDAGLVKYVGGSIGDKVWEDSNRNGIQDAGELGMAGVKVKLVDMNGVAYQTTTTDALGNYVFKDVMPGNAYRIQVEAPSGYTFTKQYQGSNTALDSDVDANGYSGYINVIAGQADTSRDVGLVKKVTTSIGDRVWEDMNGNGIQDAGEAGLAGITVKLLNSAGCVVATTTTDATGNYLFNNLTAGDYKVQVVAPTGYYYTKQYQGADRAVDSDVDVCGYSGVIHLANDQAYMDSDAGLYRKGTIGDKVWVDYGALGVQDSADRAAICVIVNLYDGNGTLVACTTTDCNGNYKFSNLNPGQYKLSFDMGCFYWYTSSGLYQNYYSQPYSWVTKNVGGNGELDSDVNPSLSKIGYTDVFTLSSGQYDNSRDAGICPIVIDLDGNGIQTIARESATGTFDLLGNGSAIKSGWISGGDAFLAVDRNGNGRIDDINELFGGNRVGNGFGKLADFDSNGDGVVDARDAHFADLKLWRDANGNHQTDEGELIRLADAGITSLKLDYKLLPAVDEQGNLHVERSSASFGDGRTVDMTDVYFNVAKEDGQAAGGNLLDLGSLLRNDQTVDQLLGKTVGLDVTPHDGANGPLMTIPNTLTPLVNLYDHEQALLIAA